MTSASSKTSAKRHIIANGDPLMYNVRSPGANDERLPLIKGNNLSSSQLANANYRKKLPVPPSYPPSRSKDRQAARNNVILQSNSSTYRRWKGKKHPHHQQAVLTHDRDDAVSEDGAMDPHSNEKNQSYNNTGMAVQTARHGNLPSLTQGSGEETSSPTALYPMGMPSYMSPFDKKFQHTNSSSGLAYYSNDQSMTPGGGISSSSNSTASAAVTPQYQVPLTNYEEEEIKQYSPDVFFCGTESCKKVNAVRGSSHNSGYDDDNSHYKIVVGDHIAYRYEILKELGRGTFGVVVKAMDHKRNCQVAVKLIRNNPTYTKQAKEEVHLLEVLKNGDPRDHANIVRLIDSGMFRNHYIMVFELLVMDLYIMCQQQKFKPVSMDYLLDFTEQMLTSLTYVHSNHIIHCDVKPENIVICSESSRAASNSHYRRLKLIDFGSACREDKRMFTYIQSRYYRAPEIVLGIPYTCAIDMWSFGCVLCELANGYPIFPACCEGELLERMTEYLGDFSQDLIAKGKRAHKFFLESGELKADLSKKHRQRRSPGSRSLQMFLKSAFHEKDSLFLDFVSRCLIYHPDKRMTAVEAREHPWVKSRRQQ